MSRLFFRNSPEVLLALLLTAVPAFAADQKAGPREPIVITAERMEADKLDDTVVFIGQVVLKKEAMTLNCDYLTVHYDTPAKGIRDIEALGSVVVTKEGRVALANKAVYYSNEEKIVLTGDARIIENDNQLGGERITLYIRDDRSIVEGGKVLIYQEQKAGDGTETQPATPRRKQGKKD
ncbi:MAG: lipopolysaccharide transport periplasmic protein LptA [Nitrospirota bacterium]|nr:lipopolysaccharide transport periplasmic protein LptA [Nitrospirota bacterium]